MSTLRNPRHKKVKGEKRKLIKSGFSPAIVLLLTMLTILQSGISAAGLLARSGFPKTLFYAVVWCHSNLTGCPGRAVFRDCDLFWPRVFKTFFFKFSLAEHGNFSANN